MESGRYIAIVFTNSRNKQGYLDLWELTVWGYIEADANYCLLYTSVVGSTKGVMTDLDGSFELSGVKPTDKLKFECLGKETQILEVGSMTNFIVKLKNAANELDEVTIVAFGKQRCV